MPIGPDILLQLVKKHKLVENLAERELTNPEGAGFDLRVGEVYELKGEGFLGVTERKTPDTKLVVKFESKKNNSLILKPGDYYLFKTMETINLPDNIGAVLYTRSTLFRSGIAHFLSQISPGYKGSLVMAVANLGPCEVEIEMGARFTHVQFDYIAGKGSEYRGQWKGGRVQMKEKEVQV